jgi:hypothetical protein
MINAHESLKNLTFDDAGKIVREKKMHFYYDCIIFTLNTLTNIAESSSFQELRKAFLETSVDGDRCALLWLSHWAVVQTEAFREHARENEISDHRTDSVARESDNRIDRSEGESLVTAGNCFVLLACMMRETFQGKKDSCFLTRKLEYEEATNQARHIICAQLPGNGTAGVHFIIQILKAFCNYYHYSIGELSSAVVEPIIRLLSDLENMTTVG